jgi:hypothetical protein
MFPNYGKWVCKFFYFWVNFYPFPLCTKTQLVLGITDSNNTITEFARAKNSSYPKTYQNYNKVWLPATYYSTRTAGRLSNYSNTILEHRNTPKNQVHLKENGWALLFLIQLHQTTNGSPLLHYVYFFKSKQKLLLNWILTFYSNHCNVWSISLVCPLWQPLRTEIKTKKFTYNFFFF